MDNMEELVKTYLTIRNEREKIEAEYKAQDDALKGELKVIEQTLLASCNQHNLNGFRTENGTVTRMLKERYTCSDRDNFNKFVLETGAVDLFAAHLHQSNFKEFMAERHADGLPPGVNVMREYSIVVKKPSVKASI